MGTLVPPVTKGAGIPFRRADSGAGVGDLHSLLRLRAGLLVGDRRVAVPDRGCDQEEVRPIAGEIIQR